ncbi:NUDIX domain-containing protein [Bifidobacterium felsineum]|uniref:ADP-ribose pyrophosphatase n=1 Tax=Bifidobacterium felsineum TaxID=2045440 RepID=A0A2M9HKX5_9BIFI|nr:NUDIX hydrolase [Bifidobacterium felsineum]MBT1164693.1 NUDIX hydrolase [Bifidobacterium felsineum]PJM77462.1 ADP-ribose pyrophosphatase [Bifidobacterium felsineum]
MSNETYRQFDPWRPSPVKEISRKQIVETHYFNIDHVTYESAKGGQFDRYCIQDNSGDTVAVLALTSDGKIPLVEQYRVANHRWTLEIPGGHAAGSERPFEAAQRKLAEEGGFEASKLTQFTRFLNTPSYSTQHTCIFFATGLSAASRQSIGPETPRSEVRMVTVDEAYEMILNGTIVDAKTIIAILRLKSGSLDHLND